MKKRTRLLLVLLWILVVLYPHPLVLVATLERTISPPVDANAVRDIAPSLPDDPNAIHDLVLTKLVPYDLDWNIYGVPWYFPSAGEVARDRRGDCESQAVMLASLLEAKGIPYQLKMSFDHIWVDFEQKRPEEMESDAVAFASREGEGYRIALPKKFDLNHFLTVQADARWHPMPGERKLLLVVGLLVIVMGQMALSVLEAMSVVLRGALGWRAGTSASSGKPSP